MSEKSDHGEHLTDEECQKLVEQFVELTNTNDALAQFFLQDREWNVLLAVNDYFKSAENENAKTAIKTNSRIVEVTLSDSSDEESCAILNQTKKRKKDDLCSSLERNTFRFITWNIDGLSGKNLLIRTEAVCSIISSIDADVVHLQEVVPESEQLIREKLQNYVTLSGNKTNDVLAYYTLILLNKKTIQVEDWKILDFKTTEMSRNILMAKIKVHGVGVTVFNSHLESTKSARVIRISQLSEVLNYMKKEKDDNVVIFAGDMNLRDSELNSVGGLPKNVIDVWQATGCRKECEYTWDMTRNDNLEWGSVGGGKRMPPRCRFDRIFLRDSFTSKLRPQYFGLIGLERLKPFVCFPSDHWGLFSEFSFTQSL